MLRKLLLVIIILGALILAAGCSDNNAKQESGNQPDNSAATVTKNIALPVKDIVQQANESGHANFFKLMVAGGPEGAEKAHYADHCIGCHSAVKMFDDPKAKLADFFPGGKHEGKVEGVTCRVCHTLGGEHGIGLRKKGWAVCGDCHTGNVTLGKEVHHPQNEMIRGIGVGEVPDTPSYKCFNMIDFTCYDCHITNAYKHDFLVPGVTTKHEGVARISAEIDYTKFAEVMEQEKCKSCHAIVQDTVDSVKKKQEDIKKRIEEIKPLYDQWSEKTGELDPADPKVKKFSEAATYFTYVEADASKGAHNYELAKALLIKAEEKLKELQ